MNVDVEVDIECHECGQSLDEYDILCKKCAEKSVNYDNDKSLLEDMLKYFQESTILRDTIIPKEQAFRFKERIESLLR